MQNTDTVLQTMQSKNAYHQKKKPKMFCQGIFDDL